MSAPYQLILLGADQFVTRLREAIREQVERRIGHGVLEITHVLEPVDDDPATIAPHRVVVWVGPERADEELESLRRGVEASLPILPVVIDRDYRSLPELVEALNAVSLRDNEAGVVEAILRMLGLAESERRVFISYRRQDTTALADQLRHALLDRGFDVFIDRYAIEPGADVQRRIDIELGDKALVLVLESPSMLDSKWIQHEVDYASEHRISLFALTVPEVTDRDRIRKFDGRRRWLHARELRDTAAGRELTSETLDEVCTQLEVIHATRLRRHREQMMRALTAWLTHAGYTARVGRDWTVIAERDDERKVFLITPRAPTAKDLYGVHLARSAIAPRPHAIVAHNPRDLDAELVALNAWVAEDRDLSTAVLEDLRDELMPS